jgi:hypothetical protein
MRTSETRAMQLLALSCLIVTAFMLCFSQRARGMVAGLGGSPALRQHLAGRRLLMANLTRAPGAKFDDYDGHTNTAVQLKDDAWPAGGFVEYDWRGARRRDRWSCAFDARTREVLALEVVPTREPSPDFVRQLEVIRHGLRPRVRPSTARAIEEGWGWREK